MYQISEWHDVPIHRLRAPHANPRHHEARDAFAAALAGFVESPDSERYLWFTNAAGLCRLSRVQLVFDVA